MRSMAILHAIRRAILSAPAHEPVPNIEFSFTVLDQPDTAHLQKTIWALTRTEDDPAKWLMSDFGYWTWPLDLVGSYEQVRRRITSEEPGFEEKKKQVIWRGAVKTNKFRQRLVELTKGKAWADVKDIQWKSATEVSGHDLGSSLSMPEHCQYQFVLQTEGRSYSGRGKYLQNCNSVVIMHKRKSIEPHHALLISSGPSQNFVEVDNKFSDLEAKVQVLLENPEQAQKIA